jgi:nitrogen regulatory protein PII
MKKIIAIIRPEKYFATKDALNVAGFAAASMKEVVGRGKERVAFEIVDANETSTAYNEYLVAKKWIEIYIRDEDEERLVKTIFSVNSSEHHGDGKIFVLPVEECIRIRTGEKSENALM